MKMLSQIMDDDRVIRYVFVLLVMDLFLSKLSRLSLYNLVPFSQSLNLSDPFARKYDPSKRKGVVGSTGSTAPIAPIPTEIKPKVTNITFILFLSYFSCLLIIYFFSTLNSIPSGNVNGF